jgi:uncharacterized protein
MKLTRFHVLVRDFPLRGEHVLYNTLTDNLVGLDDRSLDWIASLEDGRARDPLEQEEVDYLVEEQFLVDDDVADDRALRDFMLGIKRGDGVLRLRVLVTENCNFACPYCFEAEGGPTGPGMGRHIEEALHAWVRRRMAAYDLHTLELTYFGGEPLLKKPLILRTAERFQRELAEDGRRFRCNVITNGALLDRPFVDAMRPLGLDFVKVTLDGPKHHHDRARVHKDGRGSWDEILANLKAVAGRVRIHIGSNVPAGLEREYEALADELEREGLAGAIERLKFKPVLDAHGAGGCATRFSDVSPDGLVRLRLKAESAGMGVDPEFGLGPCGLHMDQYLLVDAGGYLYKCDVVVGDPKLAVGRVTDERWLPRVELLEQLDPIRDCGQCPYLPVCAGGCRATTYRREGHLGVSCEHDYFDTVGRETVKRRYLDEFYEGELPSEEVAA